MSEAHFGGRFPVALTFDLDAESNWIARDPANLQRPVTLSQGAYGPKVGLRRILDLLDRFGIKTTFFIPGWVIDRWEPQVEGIVARGHEIAHHGWLHDWPDQLESREQEGKLLERGIEEIVRVTGQRPRGYRSPGELSAHTLELLVELGFTYSSNFLDGDFPYLHSREALKGTLVELPYQFQLDDAPFSAFSLRLPGRQLYPPQSMLEIWRGEFDGLIREADAYFMLIGHPQYVGRVGRMAVLEELVSHIARQERVWFARCDEIARIFLAEEAPSGVAGAGRP